MIVEKLTTTRIYKIYRSLSDGTKVPFAAVAANGVKLEGDNVIFTHEDQTEEDKILKNE